MLIELSPDECARLLRLVDSAIVELGPEIHHTRTYKDDLKEQRRELRQLRERLAAGAGAAAEAEDARLVGTP